MGCANFFKYHPDATLDEYCKRFGYDGPTLVDAVKKTDQYKHSAGEEEQRIMKALLELDTKQATDVIYMSAVSEKPSHYANAAWGAEKPSYSRAAGSDDMNIILPNIDKEFVAGNAAADYSSSDIIEPAEEFEYIFEQDDEKKRVVSRRVKKKVKEKDSIYESNASGKNNLRGKEYAPKTSSAHHINVTIRDNRLHALQLIP